jgi:hypothetical protein
LIISFIRVPKEVTMQVPQADPVELASDEAEAFIGQEGVDLLDGEIIDDLDGEGKRACSWASGLTNAAWAAAAAAAATARAAVVHVL